MKYLSAVVLTLLLSVTLASAVSRGTVAGDIGSIQPANVTVVNMFDTDGTDTVDSIGVDTTVILGPYKLADASGQPMYAAFQLWYPADLFVSGDSIQVSYQLIPGTAVSDTTAGWTAIDTVADAGERGANTSLANLQGKGIVFKVVGMGNERAIIKKAIKALYRKSFSYTKTGL